MASPESTNPRLLYTPQALAACEKALRTILTNIGPWGSRLFLIGGLTPRYLVGTVPRQIREHVGSTDLDIVVGITLATEEAEAYRTLQQNLRAAQFAPARNRETSGGDFSLGARGRRRQGSVGILLPGRERTGWSTPEKSGAECRFPN